MTDFKKGGSMLYTKLELKQEETTAAIGRASGTDEIMSLVEQTQELQEQMNASRCYEVRRVRGSVQLTERSLVNNQGWQLLACEDLDEMELKLAAALEAVRAARKTGSAARYVVPA